MATTGLQVLGLLLSLTGWAGGALVCAAPWWRVSAFAGDELVVSEVLWEGLWMTCLSQWGKVQCKVFDSGLALSGSAQLCRGLTVLSLLLCLLALPLAVAGLKCTHCLGDQQGPKASLVRAAAVLFVFAAVVFLLPITWTAYVVIRDFYDPNVAPPLKRELGPAIYLGWIVAVVMLVGGAVLYMGSTSTSAPPIISSSGRNNPEPATMEDKAAKAYV
ncbi:claudin-9 [Pygocentrus nattereri]|uniref:Claudin n=1 Tax=Pygocentrus nattereri TaxID=42514 RepID=A0AAR2LC06_PYGNA|nr:claudin-9 [Pygocentrus nattereri]